MASVQEVFGLEQEPFGDVEKEQGILSEFCTNWSRSRNGSNAQTLVKFLLEQPYNVWHNEDATCSELLVHKSKDNEDQQIARWLALKLKLLSPDLLTIETWNTAARNFLLMYHMDDGSLSAFRKLLRLRKSFDIDTQLIHHLLLSVTTGLKRCRPKWELATVIMEEEPKCVEQPLEQGDHDNPLHYATKAGQTELVRSILEHTKNPIQRDTSLQQCTTPKTLR